MFTPSKQRENELLHKLTHGALQLVTHTIEILRPPTSAEMNKRGSLMQVSLPSPRRLFRNRKLKVFDLWTLVGQDQSCDKDSKQFKSD